MSVLINLAESAGFCFGVKRALSIALASAKSNSSIEMLGDIVHNENVAKDIKNSGIKRVKRLVKGKNKTLLIQAHGISLKTLKRAKKLDYKIIDATCPMVKEIHKIAVAMERKKYKIIIIGDKKHAEVKGIAGHLNTKPLVIENKIGVKAKETKNIKKACIVVQSTQNIEKVREISALLNKHIKNVKFFNTICTPTRKKQREIRSMPLKNDIMIIIGSKNSANTKRLYEISKLLNKRSYWIQSSSDLDKHWFKKAESVGIAAGASTPGYITKDVVKKIIRLTN